MAEEKKVDMRPRNTVTSAGVVTGKPWRTPLNYVPEPGERNLLPSLTEPDLALSVQQIIDNHTRGLPISTRTPIYEGDEPGLPEWETLDLAERHLVQEAAKEELRAIAEKRKQEEIDRKKASQEARRKQFQDDYLEYQESLKSKDTSAAPSAGADASPVGDA